ncbi:hypothetical protein HK414_12075 [Ramlibacter terrae]|uniref:Amidase domain-containing protein n=1 Tax=Ramlibacter terrae TaxID=2732511 RepID=A0ABX6P2I9_9BURK|nr:hypothetical protein HK414_12075 [Ramlibacter terrae]
MLREDNAPCTPPRRSHRRQHPRRLPRRLADRHPAGTWLPRPHRGLRPRRAGAAGHDHDQPRRPEEALRLDTDFKAHPDRIGPLHGIPIILKDNFNTKDLPTTGGSVALKDFQPSADAFIVDRLRRAGAIILGKANMTEFARGGISGQQPGRAGAQPLRPVTHARRLQRRDRRGHRRQLRHRRHRQRHRAVDPLAGFRVQPGRRAAHARVDQPHGRDAQQLHPG